MPLQWLQNLFFLPHGNAHDARVSDPAEPAEPGLASAPGFLDVPGEGWAHSRRLSAGTGARWSAKRWLCRSSHVPTPAHEGRVTAPALITLQNRSPALLAATIGSLCSGSLREVEPACEVGTAAMSKRSERAKQVRRTPRAPHIERVRRPPGPRRAGPSDRWDLVLVAPAWSRGAPSFSSSLLHPASDRPMQGGSCSLGPNR